MIFTSDFSKQTDKLRTAIKDADAIVVGAGAGLSASAGLTYSGERFTSNFADFTKRYGLTDMYSATFYPFKSPEEFWAYMSRHIYINRYSDIPNPTYADLFEAIKNKEYFVITTNVDHCFQRSGFDKQRLFYTQGDYGLWQCSVPCHNSTYDNKEIVLRMVNEQKDLRIPSELVPLCPKCGKSMSMNLRSDNTFVEDEGWHKAHDRYTAFIKKYNTARVIYLELGVGFNTPGIIKYPFWQFTVQNPKATYVCVNQGEAYSPNEIVKQAICIDSDIGAVIKSIL